MRTVECHPNEKYYAKGKCKKCYHREVAQQSVKKKYWRTFRLKTRYGLTEEDYQRMYDKQNGVCCICHRPQKTGPLHVDHNHTTGAVRGLLCAPCNRVIGYMENANWFAEASKYLEFWNT